MYSPSLLIRTIYLVHSVSLLVHFLLVKSLHLLAKPIGVNILDSILKSQPTIDGDHGFDRYKHTNKKSRLDSMGKTIQLSGFPHLVSAERVKEFLEKHTGKGTVYALEVREPKKRGSRAYATVQFTSAKSSEHIISLANQRLYYGSSYLKAYAKDFDIVQKPKISKEKFSVLWKKANVSVKFENLHGIKAWFKNLASTVSFFVYETQASQSRLGLRSSSVIISNLRSASAPCFVVTHSWYFWFANLVLLVRKLHRCASNSGHNRLQPSCLWLQMSVPFAVRGAIGIVHNIYQLENQVQKLVKVSLIRILLLGAPRIYEKYEGSVLNFFKEIPDDQWVRSTDFTPVALHWPLFCFVFGASKLGSASKLQ
ncbi:hypothetical protein HYC85_015913 [Camellia sinensis]|uniref:RDR1/2-like RRM domain-containing protein n=1 Tax=Camellia sinensis TaxID=4442 RepID=A0A7J7GZG1_CAMSI|nr:hypothetical protein HYC85_015913 [Camellia sinensis]